MEIGFAASPDRSDTIRTKSRIRSAHAKPTIEQTTELARTTIIPALDLPPDQTVAERVTEMNKLLQQAGVEPYRLRLIVRHGDTVNQMRFKDELRIREIPLAVALKFLCDSTKLRYHMRENGIVELTSMQEQDFLSDSPKQHESKKPSPSGATDAFGNDSSASGETDPFAVPMPTR